MDGGKLLRLARPDPNAEIAEVLAGRQRVAVIGCPAEDLLATLPSGSVDLFLCDPPYSSGGMVRGDRAHGARATAKYTKTDQELDILGDTRDQLGFIAWASCWLREAHRVLKPGAIAAVFTDWRQLGAVTAALQAGGLVWRGVMTWHKGQSVRPQPGRPRQESEFIVWGTAGARPFEGSPMRGHFSGQCPAGERFMVCSKPVALLEELCEMAPPGGVVLDPFLGAGTTAVAALRRGRRCIGSELAAPNLRVAQERIAAELGEATRRRAA